VRANRAFHLNVSGISPALIADEDERGRIEVVSIDDGEVLLFWELPARVAARLARELRCDLAQCSVEEFLDKWQGADIALED
jgi:hypothetical protein